MGDRAEQCSAGKNQYIDQSMTSFPHFIVSTPLSDSGSGNLCMYVRGVGR